MTLSEVAGVPGMLAFLVHKEEIDISLGLGLGTGWLLAATTWWAISYFVKKYKIVKRG